MCIKDDNNIILVTFALFLIENDHEYTFTALAYVISDMNIVPA